MLQMIIQLRTRLRSLTFLILALLTISRLLRFSDHLRTPAVVHLPKEQGPAFMLPSHNDCKLLQPDRFLMCCVDHHLVLMDLRQDSLKQYFIILKNDSGKKLCQPWPYGDDREERKEMWSQVLYSLMDWFGWGHQVLGNNFLSAVPYRGKIICCQMCIVLTLTICSTFLWPLVLPSTCGPNWCILCAGLFSHCCLWQGLCLYKSKTGIFFLSNLSNSCFVILG